MEGVQAPGSTPQFLLGPHTALGELQTQDLRSHTWPGFLNSFIFTSWPGNLGSQLWGGLQAQSKEP